jgi:hypothetical protein
MYDSFGRKMGVLRDCRYREVRRYYISNQSEWGRRHGVRRYRTRADPLEQLIVAATTAFLVDRERLRGLLLGLGIHDGSLNRLCAAGSHLSKVIETATPKRAQCILKALVERIEISDARIKLIVRVPELPRLLQWDGVGLFRGDTANWSQPHITHVIDVPANAISMKRELTLLLKRHPNPSNEPNRRLVGLLNKARSAQAVLDERQCYGVEAMAARVSCHPKRFTRLVRLNYLAPDIIASIRDGTQPAQINCQRLMAVELPMDWTLQRRLLGFPDQPDFLKAAPGW